MNPRRAVGRSPGHLVGDAVIQEQTAGAKRLESALEIRGLHPPADVFHHPDADDLVEAQGSEVAIVAHFDACARAQRTSENSPLGLVPLDGAQRDAEGVCTEALGGADDQCTPAATDVEEPFARTQAQLAQGVVDLCLLRLLQRKIVALVVRARVDEVRVQECGVEVDGLIVMKADGGDVARARVGDTRTPRGATLAVSWWTRKLQQRRGEDRKRHLREATQRALEFVNGRLGIAREVDPVLDERTCGVEVDRGRECRSKRERRAHLECKASVVPCAYVRSVPQAYREIEGKALAEQQAEDGERRCRLTTNAKLGHAERTAASAA